jgi:hypothetical protein
MSNFWIGTLFLLLLIVMLAGCTTTKPIIVTKTIDRPVPVFCEVETPGECKDAYAVDQVSTTDDPITINRAFRQEIEERWACEIKLRAALQGCNQK